VNPQIEGSNKNKYGGASLLVFPSPEKDSPK